MAPVADERLERVAGVVGARKVTLPRSGSSTSPGAGPSSSEICARWTRSCSCSTAGRERGALRTTRVTFDLELLLADREHVGRRLERVAKQAKSGDLALRRGGGRPRAPCRPPGRRRDCGGLAEPIPSDLEALTAKPLLGVVNGPGGIDLKLESELAELGEDAAAFREGASALEEIVRASLRGARPDRLLHRRREGDAGMDAAARQDSARRGRGRPTDLASGFIRAEVIRWDDLVECGSHAEAARRGLQRLEGKGYVVEDGDVLNIRFSPPR